MFENKFFGILNIIADLILLSILGLVGSLLIVTIPVAFTAICHAVSEVIISGRGSVFTEFFRGYKKNFKSALWLSLVTALVCALIIIPLYLLYPVCFDLFLFQSYEISAFFLLLLIGVMELRTLTLFAVSDMTLKRCLVIAFSMFHKKWRASGALVLSFLLFIILTIFYPPALLITPSLLAWVDLKACSFTEAV